MIHLIFTLSKLWLVNLLFIYNTVCFLIWFFHDCKGIIKLTWSLTKSSIWKKGRLVIRSWNNLFNFTYNLRWLWRLLICFNLVLNNLITNIFIDWSPFLLIKYCLINHVFFIILLVLSHKKWFMLMWMRRILLWHIILCLFNSLW